MFIIIKSNHGQDSALTTKSLYYIIVKNCFRGFGMSIPKIIHYCWFGGNPFSDMERDCIESWRQHCPDYEIIEWNESNVDLSKCQFAQDALKDKKWAFVSDYVRNMVVYEYGGIYFDTDVKVIKSLDPLLELDAFGAFEDEWTMATGLGFGAAKHNSIVKEFMESYHDLSYYDENGNPNPALAPAVTTEIMVKHGLQLYNNVIQQVEDFTVFPIDYFCPLDIRVNKMKITENTYSIHYYSASWYTDEQRKMRVIMTRRRKLERIIGKKLYRVWETIRFILFEGGFKSILKSKLGKK